MSESGSQRRGLPGACARENEDGPFGRQNGLALGRVQALQIGRFRTQCRRFRHLAEVGKGERIGNSDGGLERVPIVVPDIPVIHRLVTENFASATRIESAWSSSDRGGSPSLPGKAGNGNKGEEGTEEPISAGRNGKNFRVLLGPAGKRRRKR